MATARPGSSNISAVHVWLIAFVVLFLGATVWLVIMYTNQEQLRADAKKAADDVKVLQTSADRGDPLVTSLTTFGRTSSPSQSLTRTMLNEIHALAGNITGDKTHGRAEAEARMDVLIERIRDDKVVPKPEQVKKTEGLVNILGNLYAWYVNEHDSRVAAEKQLKDANDSLAKAQETIKDLGGKFDTSLKGVNDQVADLQKSKSEFEATKTTEIEDLGKKIAAGTEMMGQARQDMAKQATEFGMKIQSKDAVIKQQLAKIGDVQGPPAQRASEDAVAREPIGRVLRALPGDSIVHIDLGELDGVNLGMRFAVYSSDRRIPPDGRGKANIEVVSVGPHTSECRVVNPAAPDDPILDEDYVQNIILARNRSHKQRFVILGEFDIDYDGRTDAKAAERLRAYVERFGGEVAGTVDATVDFVIVGRKAGDVEGAKGAQVDPTAEPANRDAKKSAQTYEEAIARAQLLNIPRLRQDVFLNFIGLEPGKNVGKRLLP